MQIYDLKQTAHINVTSSKHGGKLIQLTGDHAQTLQKTMRSVFFHTEINDILLFSYVILGNAI